MKGINKDHKRSFVKHRNPSSRPHRFSDSASPLNSTTEPHFITKHLSSSSLDPPRVGHDISPNPIRPRQRPTSDSPRAGRESLPDMSKYLNNDRSTDNSALNKFSPKYQRTRDDLSPDSRNHRVGKALSPDIYRSGHNSDQWDSIASSHSESSVDILSGSCDSLDVVSMETPSVSKSSSPPIKRGESSAVKVSSVDKKNVIKNLAVITSLDQDDNQEEDRCSPCGPDAQVISSRNLNDHSDLSCDSTDPASESHYPTGVSDNHTNMSHGPTSVSHDHDEVTLKGFRSLSMNSDISSQSIHVDFQDTPSHSLEDIAEDTAEELITSKISNKKLLRSNVKSTSSVQSIGK